MFKLSHSLREFSDRKSGTNMLKLREAVDKSDNNKIILCLVELRKSSKNKEIDRLTFEILVNLIKTPNTKIINYTLSILANCCMSNKYRTIFKEVGGVSHLALIVKTVDNDSIICRACRLIGNLALSTDLAKELCANNTGLALLGLLDKQDNLSADTLTMAFRGIKKLWAVAEIKWKMLPDDLLPTFKKCLYSENEQSVLVAIESLLLFTQFKSVQRNGPFKINKEVFLKLLELSKKEKFKHLTVSCLSNLISYQTSNVWEFIEGSSVTEVFIEYLENFLGIDAVVYLAFFKLCTEGGVRNKVRIAGLLPRLIDTCNSSNVKHLLPIFYLFQYDQASMLLCSQNPKFISILFDNISMHGSIQLIAVLSRLNPPVKALVSPKNLDILIQNKDCLGILKNVTRTIEFLKPILTSGKVWEIEKVGCTMEEMGCLGPTEDLLINLLNSREKKCREDVSLAVPFLLKPRNFKLLFKLLAHHHVITTILHLLKENPTEERVLASVIRLITIFRSNYQQSNEFFQDADETLKDFHQNASFSGNKCISSGQEFKNHKQDIEIVTFELDNNDTVDVNKDLVCQNSPVLDSMLNGHFMEAGQKKVKLRKCSKDGLLTLESLLKGKVDYSGIPTEVYLELISLTDRYLIITLNSVLTENLKIDENSCPLVYQWYRKAGYTKNITKIRKKIYEFLFSSSERLLLAMQNKECRIPLVNEISQYLSNSLKDLL